MRVGKPRRDLDLTQEPVGSQRGGQLGPQHLHGHLAVVFQVLGEVNRGHATSAEFLFECVVLGESCFEAFELF